MTMHIDTTDLAGTESQSFVTFKVAGQLFGVPVTRVQDILAPDAIARCLAGQPMSAA